MPLAASAILLPAILLNTLSGVQSTVQLNFRVTIPIFCVIDSVEIEPANNSTIRVSTTCNAEYFDLLVSGALSDNRISGVEIDTLASTSFAADRLSFRQTRPGRSTIRIMFEDKVSGEGPVQLQLIAK